MRVLRIVDKVMKQLDPLDAQRRYCTITDCEESVEASIG